MPRPPGGHVFQPTSIIFELVQDIIRMNLLTKFHEDRTINVASREKNSPPLGSHVFQANTNLPTKFHEDWTINVASRVLKRKNAPPLGSHVFQPTGIIFKLLQDIIGMNLLTKFHEDRTINVASREKNAQPLGSHVFQANTNLLTKFHEDRKINLTSKVLTRKNAPPPRGHFHEDRTINVAKKNASPLGSHVFLANITIFEHIQDIIETNLLTKFHEDWTINVASREKNAPPLGSHTNLLTKFHEDWTINANVDVAQRTTDKAQRTTDKRRSQKLIMSTTSFWPGMTHIQLLTKFESGHEKSDGQTDRLTDRPTDRQCEKYILPIQLLTKCGEDRMKTT
ncbi:hypothetical protein DPMN_107080 [Dreissena polymorpha]|uniref:Uncharacterized protein n=1 Tax=Dreissena polymorpha TaxID=45954 RepID=A0A9D4K6E8_DREPO|nr:hypothetical protein DPMN_107080 [Dreissena polymorpha]